MAFRERLLAKIAQLDTDLGDMLADFVTAMIENNKPRDHILAELTDLIGPEDAATITLWIFEKENSKKSKKEALSAKGLSLVQAEGTNNSNAVDLAKSNKDHDPPKNNKRQFEMTAITWDYDTTPSAVLSSPPPQKSIKFAKYSTPGIPAGIIEKPVANLVTKIAEDKALMGQYPCFFGAKCTRPQCSFSHPTETLKPSTSSINLVCKFYPNCLNTQCKFQHPVAATTKTPATLARPNIKISSPQNIICKFAAGCMRPGCYFLHPNRPEDQIKLAALQNSSRENKSHISERGFAARDAQVMVLLTDESILTDAVSE